MAGITTNPPPPWGPPGTSPPVVNPRRGERNSPAAWQETIYIPLTIALRARTPPRSILELKLGVCEDQRTGAYDEVEGGRKMTEHRR